MIHPAAYIEFRKWHIDQIGTSPGILLLAWHWFRQFISSKPAMAPARMNGISSPVFLRPWSSDLYVFSQIFLQQEYGIDLPAPKSILDAGANVGLASVYFANRFPMSHIVAVEPEESNFKVLQENTRSYPNITCIKAAVWHRHARLVLQNAQDKSWAFRFGEVEDATSGYHTEGIEIDRIAQLYNGGAAFDMVKIDIEGAEREVFAAGGEWLVNTNTVLIECHDRIAFGCEATVLAAMTKGEFAKRRSGEYLVFERRLRSQSNS